MRIKIGQIYKLEDKQGIHALLSVALIGENKVGLISLPFHTVINGWDDIGDCGIWSKRIADWIQSDIVNSPEWNTISEEQFKHICGDLWDYNNYIPIDYNEYIKILSSGI